MGPVGAHARSVIALAYKRFDGAASAAELRELPRAAVEAGLEHGGFAVFQCPLKVRPRAPAPTGAGAMQPPLDLRCRVRTTLPVQRTAHHTLS